MPDATMRASELTNLDLLSRGQFKSTVLQMVTKRDHTAWQREVRNKRKLALHTVVCDLEQHIDPRRQPLLAPKQYLKGCLTAAKRLKFSLRAGVAELQEEIERKSRGPVQ